jgi:hypothetical protein
MPVNQKALLLSPGVFVWKIMDFLDNSWKRVGIIEEISSGYA